MIRLSSQMIACLYLGLTLALAPGFEVSTVQADSSNDLAPARVNALLPTNGILPGGTPISVEIMTPSDGDVIVFPPGNIDLQGRAAVGESVIIKDTTVVYIMDISGSMDNSAGVNCNSSPGFDTRLECAKEAVRRANTSAKAATSFVDLTGLGSFEGSGVPVQCISTAHDVNLGAAGSQLLVDPNLDGDGNSIADVEQVALGLATGIFTCYIGGLQRADEILASSNNAFNIIFFMSDGDNTVGPPVSTFVPAHFGSNTRIHALAMGTNVSCSSSSGTFALGNLNDVVAKSTLAGGTCQQVTDLSQLDNLITYALRSSLDSIKRQLDGTTQDISGSAVPSIPKVGPTGNVAFSESNIPAAPGIHNLCVTANGKDRGGDGSATQCIKVTIADINLFPPTATNDLSLSSTHTVTATVAAGADGGVAGVAVNFEILSGPNAGAVGSGTTDGDGEAAFTYTAIPGPAGLGTDVIQACFGPDEQGDTACDMATKTWAVTADLSITKSDLPDPVMAGDPLTYTLTVANNGPGDASGVTVTDTLPTGVTLVSATPSQGTCTVVTCDLGNLANGTSAVITIAVTVDTATPAGTITNMATVSASETDPDATNNTASADTMITAAPNVCTILDEFNRADGPLGSNWAGRTAGYRIRSNQVAVRRGRAIYWQPEAYGPDQEACVTLTRINPKSRQHALLLKVQELNNWRKGAILVSYNARSGNVEVKARDVAHHRWILVGSFTPPTPVVDGDQLRAKAFADGTVEVFINNTSIGSADAGSFYANKGGQIGLWFRGRQAEADEDDDHDRSIHSNDHDDNDGDDDTPAGRPAVLDDFGGGTIAAP